MEEQRHRCVDMQRLYFKTGDGSKPVIQAIATIAVVDIILIVVAIIVLAAACGYVHGRLHGEIDERPALR